MTIFKPYDVRGTVPNNLDAPKAWAIGRAFAKFLALESGNPSPLIVIGRDARAHSPALTAAFMAGIADVGGRVVDAGLCTTPMLYHAVGSLAGTPNTPAGGAMVTASHNGPTYNGFKLCRALAAPISMDSGLAEIQRLSDIPCDTPSNLRQLSLDVGDGTDRALPINVVPDRALITVHWPVKGVSLDAACPVGANPGLWASYTAHMAGMKRMWPSHVVLAIDPANGMGCFYPVVLAALGADVHVVNGKLSSQPTHEANPLKPANMVDCQDLVRERKANLGVALDGDADRVVFVHEGGDVVPSDLTTAILARSFLTRYPGSAVLYDLRSSRAVRELIVERGGRPVRERVGHSFMKATLRKEDCVIGGELSGHFYHRACHYADNSLATIIELLNVMGACGETLSAQQASVKRYAQSGELNYHVADKDAVMKKLASTYPTAQVDWLDGVTVQFKDWWFNVRPSNTEPLLRLNVEAKTDQALATRVSEVATLIGGTPEAA